MRGMAVILALWLALVALASRPAAPVNPPPPVLTPNAS